MIDNITNNEILSNNSILQQQEVLGVEKKSASKNPYDKNVYLSDESDISDQALSLYEKEKDVQKYKNLVLEAISKDVSTSDLVKLINNQNSLISNDDLADKLANDKDFMSLLFPKE
jgi:hypothetical protein